MEQDERFINRLNLLHRTIDSTYQNLKDVLFSEDSDEVFLAFKSLLDLIFSADEMHFSDEYYERREICIEGKFLSGLRFAANQLKHGKLCYEIHRIDTKPMFSFPISGPFVMGIIEAKWIPIETLPNKKIDNNKHFIQQKQVYNEYLVGREVFQAFDGAIYFLNKEKNKYA